MLIELFVVGFIIGIIIDAVWWNINYSKYEKGLEIHEHYHIGIEIGIIGVLLTSVVPILSTISMGIMIAFILKESSQDHPFALKSGHFKKSSYIGIGLFILFAILLII